MMVFYFIDLSSNPLNITPIRRGIPSYVLQFIFTHFPIFLPFTGSYNLVYFFQVEVSRSPLKIPFSWLSTGSQFCYIISLLLNCVAYTRLEMLSVRRITCIMCNASTATAIAVGWPKSRPRQKKRRE